MGKNYGFSPFAIQVLRSRMAKLLPVADPSCLYRSSGSRRRPAILGDLVLDAEDPLTIQFWGDFIRCNMFF